MQHLCERDCRLNVFGGGPGTGATAGGGGGVSLVGGCEGGRGGSYKTQTVKGVGVESPEEETGKGLLIAAMIFSAIVGFVYGGFCFVLRKTESGSRVTWFYSWPCDIIVWFGTLGGVPESCGPKSRMRSSRHRGRRFDDKRSAGRCFRGT